MTGLSKIFQLLENTVPANNDTNTYEQDGLIYCGNCHTPLQTRQIILGKKMILPVLCKCGEEKEIIIKAKKAEAERLERTRELKNGIIGNSYQAMTFEKSALELKASHKYVSDFARYKAENVGLMFIGSKGTGKTYAAATIANALTDNGISVLMANVTWFVAQMQEFNHQDFITSLQKPELLIIDDIGVERENGYMFEQIYTVIDTRYQSQKPLIITSNITLEELKNCTDIRQDRIYDRLKEMCVPIVMAGESLRVKKANNRFLRLKEEFT